MAALASLRLGGRRRHAADAKRRRAGGTVARRTPVEYAAEAVQIVVMLGGQGTGYKRERGRAVQRMVSEIYSAPRVPKAMKLMPGLELVPGFALDLSGNDEEGNAWDFTRADMRVKAKALVMRESPSIPMSPSYSHYSSSN